MWFLPKLGEKTRMANLEFDGTIDHVKYYSEVDRNMSLNETIYSVQDDSSEEVSIMSFNATIESVEGGSPEEDKSLDQADGTEDPFSEEDEEFVEGNESRIGKENEEEKQEDVAEDAVPYQEVEEENCHLVLLEDLQ